MFNRAALTGSPTTPIKMYEEDTDFPEYGRQVNLNEAWRGYARGTIIGRNGCRFVIQLSSGATIDLYEDEFEYN